MITRMIPEYIMNTPVGINVYGITFEPPHYQKDSLEFILCISGTVEITVAHRLFTMRAGDVVVINPHDVHYITSKSDNVLASFFINTQHKNYIDKDLGGIDFDNIGNNFVLGLNGKLLEIKKRLFFILYQHAEFGILMPSEKVTVAVDEIINIMSSSFRQFYMDTDENPQAEELKERFERIMKFLKTNYNRKITVEELGMREHMSSNYLSQYIKKASSASFTRILTYIRTHESEVILLSKAMDIREIAYECGFSDPKFYFKSFKELYMRTPYQHRKMYEKLTSQKGPIKVEYDAKDKTMEILHLIATTLLCPNHL